MTRRWFERGVFVAAALASIATSPKHWRVDATVPAIPSPIQTTRLVFHASQMPIVELRRAGGFEVGHVVALGRDDYELLVPAGTEILGVFLDGRCHAHLLCGDDCVVPDGTSIALTSAKPVATWRIEITTAEQHLELDPMAYSTTATIAVSSSRPVVAHVDSSAAGPVVVADSASAVVMWQGVRAKTPVTWTAHLAIEGPCPDDAPCQPPPDAHLTVQSINVTSDAPR